MTVGAFPAFCLEQWPRIRAALEDGTYRPAAVRRVEIPKPIVQQALSNRWLEGQGVPDMRTLWIRLHYGPKARV